MICPKCKKLLIKKQDNNDLKLHCESCNNIYESKDTEIYSDKRISFNTLPKSGKSIYYYPANQRIKMDCPSCPAKILSWIKDNNKKIYGCRCGKVMTME